MRPVTTAVLVDDLVRRVVEHDGRVRVLVDGAPPTRPSDLADALVAPLRAAGRAVVRVHAEEFLRPASVRFEHGRHDADSLEDRLDVGALGREVLDPFAASGRYLPTLWDVRTDRATRAGYEQAPDRAVLVLDGSLLLGRWLDAELTVHLTVRRATLERRVAADDRWTLPAFARYDEETEPMQVADVVVHVDDPRRPAIEERAL
ncbi:uridine kinase [Cellulomonas humilata]|uniref:Uridine kinase n=1 Tax=Cellulomonas humilata TaxID=144055 RepID=A0A7Y5ZZL8_9CELL|nr:uridine kinase [Cellulomonas humilata]